MPTQQIAQVLQLTRKLAGLLDGAAPGQGDDAAIRNTALQTAQCIRGLDVVPTEARERLVESLQVVAERAEPPAALLDRVGKIECELTALLAKAAP